MSFAMIWQLYCEGCGDAFDQSLITSSTRRLVVSAAVSAGWRFPRPPGPKPTRKALCPLCAVAPQMPLPEDVNG